MSATSRDTSANKGKHSIAVVARRTGISQLLLRAWERRYEAVIPQRTATGRRLYSDDDLTKLGLLRLLTDADHRIGDIAGLTIAGLGDLEVTERLVYDEAQIRGMVGSDLAALGIPADLLDTQLGRVVGKVWSAKITGRKS